MDFSQRPGDHECFDYHRDYANKAPDGNILDTLGKQATDIPKFMRAIPADQFEVVHPPYGWTIRTVLEHCCDAERVFGYRALRFAAGDATDLPGWEQDHYASCGFANAANVEDLASEFESLRNANVLMFKRFRPEVFDSMGTADGRKVSVRTIAWLMAGHWIHHEIILKERLGL
jgi:hypothetical protein